MMMVTSEWMKNYYFTYLNFLKNNKLKTYE